MLNRTLNGQKDSEKEERSWRHPPVRLQTASRSCSDHHSEEPAGTQTQGLQERIESPGMKPHVHGQFMKIRPGRSEEERTVFPRNSDRKMATYTEEHQWSSSRSSNTNLPKTPPFCTWSSFPRVLWDLWPPVSLQLDTRNVYCVLIFRSCSASLLVGTEATLLLSAWMQPRYPEAWALMVLRRQSSRQPAAHRAESKGKASCARGSEGRLAPPAGRQRRAGSPALTDLRAHPEAALLRARRLEAQTEMEQKSSMTLLKPWLRNNQSLYGMQP